MQIERNRAVSFHYTLTEGEEEAVSESKESHTANYIHGYGQIISGLESELAGKNVGDTFEIVIPPEKGYGVRDESLIEDFPIEGFAHIEELKPGMRVEAANDEGRVSCTVTRIEGDKVTLDANHPYAGKTLRFHVTVDTVREATPEEIDALVQYK